MTEEISERKDTEDRVERRDVGKLGSRGNNIQRRRCVIERNSMKWSNTQYKEEEEHEKYAGSEGLLYT